MRSFAALSFLAASLACVVRAQNINDTYVQGLINALNAANLTSFVGAVDSLANETSGKNLLSALSSGSPYTVLVPNNAAFAGVNPFFGNDKTWLGQALAYHVIPGNHPLDEVATNPNVSVYETLLTDPALVKLGGAGQRIGLTKIDGVTHVAAQDYPSVVVTTTTYENLLVHVVSAVVDLPPALKDLLTLPTGQFVKNVSTLAAKAPASVLSALESSSNVTIFAPVDAAFQRALASGFLAPNANESVIAAVLANHVINGTLVFTGEAQKNYTSAGGNEITVGTGGLDDGSGSVVYYRGTEVANILYGNIITQNGVVHLIDTVLPNAKSSTSSNAARAVSTKSNRVNSRFFRL